MRRLSLLIPLLLSGCITQPTMPEPDPITGLPRVRNIRPDVAADKATLHVQAETTFLRLDAVAGEAWAFVTTEGIDEQSVRLMDANGIRVGTMTAAQVSQFYAKLPRTGGTKVQTIGVGREPVIFETTPTLESAVDVQMLLGFDRDETVRLPAGRMQLLLDVVIDGAKVTMGVAPHHHWVSPSVTPKSPQEKALEGRVFKEISFDADLTGDRFLVLGWRGEERQEKKPAEEPAEQDTPTPSEQDAAPSPRFPARAEAPAKPRALRLGDLLLAGRRADRPLQLVCIIRVPPQGEMLNLEPNRPER